MANKRFQDVNPCYGEKDSGKETMKGGSAGRPANPSAKAFKAPGSPTKDLLRDKGGKDLPVPKVVAKDNRADEARGELPPKGANQPGQIRRK